MQEIGECRLRALQYGIGSYSLIKEVIKTLLLFSF